MSSSKAINRSNTTEVTDFNNFDASKLIFDEPSIGSIPGSTIPFARINIGIKNKNKTEGDLVFALPKLSTYGVKESLDQNTKALTGYNAGLMLFDKTSQSDEHVSIHDTFITIIEKCKDHLLQKDIQKKCKKSGLERSDLKKITPISYVKDKVTEEYQMDKPVLNVKLLYAKTRKDKDGNEIAGRICTQVYLDDVLGSNKKPIEMSIEEYLNKSGMLRAVVKVESIFVGKDIKLQVKILECAFKGNERTTGNKFLSFTNVSSFKEEEFDVEMEEEQEAPSKPIYEEREDVPVQNVDDTLVMSEDEEEPKPKSSVKKGKGKK
jgi:hypothetical protein